VLVADPSALVRTLLVSVLRDAGLDVSDVVGERRQLVELVAASTYDVLIANTDLVDGPIEDVVAHLCRGARVIVFTHDPSPERVTTLLERGVVGYLLRDIEPHGVVDAVRAVLRGETALHPSVATTVVEQWRTLRHARAIGSRTDPRVALTRRETDVLAAMADGLSTKAIARRLGVATKTVENHKTRVFDKLGVRSQAHAVATAISHGLLIPAMAERA
jgi:DNA-binding NarL/FixJ family response regulator